MGNLTFWIDSKECCSCSCSTAAAVALLLLQLQLPDIRLENAANWIIHDVIHLLLPNLVYIVWQSELVLKGAAAAAVVLLLQLLHPFESIQNVKLPFCIKLVIIDELLNLLLLSAFYLEKVLQLLQQCCSCSSSTLLNQFRLPNCPFVVSLVIINELFFKPFNLLPFPVLCLDKVLQLQQ